MSYTTRVGDHRFVFRDEESYLEAKLEYLQSGCANPLSEFLLEEMYDKDKCVVESLSYNFYANTSVTEDAYTIGVDPAASSTASCATNGILVIGTPTDSTIYTDAHTVYNGCFEGSITTDGTITWNINSPDENPEKKQCKSESKIAINEEPADPIKSRFDILDL